MARVFLSEGSATRANNPINIGLKLLSKDSSGEYENYSEKRDKNKYKGTMEVLNELCP